jgi:hypothetical protein
LCIDPDISIRRPFSVFKKNQKIPRRNSKPKIENMVKRKMTRMK